MTCPACGSRDVAEILYGEPTREAIELVEEGKIVLGGCVHRDESWHCHACEHEWGSPDEPGT